MATPQIPFISIPELPLPFLLDVPGLGALLDPRRPPSIKPFGVLVATGVLVGTLLTLRRARRVGIDADAMSRFIMYVVGFGFVGAHVFDVLFYTPNRLLRDPLLIVRVWDGISSYGGFLGALLGAAIFRWRFRAPILALCDVVMSAFPVAWLFGRAGCATAHDHIGRFSDAWYAVRFPGPDGSFVGRLDLGLIELVCCIPIALLVTALWRRSPPPVGQTAGIVSVAYAPVRFGLDFLRASPGGIVAADPRYLGLTPAQWVSFGLLALGVYLFRRSRSEALSFSDAIPPALRTTPSVPATPRPDGHTS